MNVVNQIKQAEQLRQQRAKIEQATVQARQQNDELLHRVKELSWESAYILFVAYAQTATPQTVWPPFVDALLERWKEWPTTDEDVHRKVRLENCCIIAELGLKPLDVYGWYNGFVDDYGIFRLLTDEGIS